MSKKSILSIIVFLFLVASSVGGVMAQTLNLSPQTATKTVGEELSINLNIDTVGKAISGADVILTFDSDVIEVVSVAPTKAAKESGGFFTEGSYNLSTGRLYIASFFGEAFKTETGTGKLATIVIKGKKVGSDQLVFTCTTQTNDTNIFDAQSVDVINCSGTQNGTYTFISGSSDSTSTVTSTPTPTGTGSTTTVPVSGMSLPTIFSFGFGALMMFVGLVFLF